MRTDQTRVAPSIRDIRRAVDALGASAVAQRCSVGVETVSRWTAGVSNPPMTKWATLQAVIAEAASSK